MLRERGGRAVCQRWEGALAERERGSTCVTKKRGVAPASKRGWQHLRDDAEARFGQGGAVRDSEQEGRVAVFVVSQRYLVEG